MDKTYQPLASTYLTLRDLYGEDDERIQHLLFHLETGDYFAMLATIMGFIEESLQSAAVKNEPLKERELALIRDLKKDLMYLHENYYIESKISRLASTRPL